MSLSFAATADLARDVGAAKGNLAYLVPIAIDGALLAASASLAAWSSSGAHGRRPMLATFSLGAFLLISAFLNAAHADPTWLARFIAALAPISLFIATELALSLRKHTNERAATQ
jgi:hypothetical protein